MREALRSRILVAKGCKRVRKKNGEIAKLKEDYIPQIFWGIIIHEVDSVDLDTAIARGGFPESVYGDVLIGRDEREAKRLLAAKT
jgi:hypothetical protein